MNNILFITLMKQTSWQCIHLMLFFTNFLLLEWRLHFFLCFIFQSILCNALEGCINIQIFLGRGLKIWNVSLACTPCFCLLLRNLLNINVNKWLNSEWKYSPMHIIGNEYERGHTTLLLPLSISTLFPSTTKGKLSGSEGFAWTQYIVQWM